MLPIEAVNFHIWRSCNMRCKFCFATYDSILPHNYTAGLPPEEARQLITALGVAGFKKITFAGGEPTLCPWLAEVVGYAKSIGFKTALVSNGARLTSDLMSDLSGNLDWIALSIDSASDYVNLQHGRAVGGRRPMSIEFLISVTDQFRQSGVRLKVNTVVTRFNSDEILLPIIERIQPDRWKIMRVLEILGENDEGFASLSISGDELNRFASRNSPMPDGTVQVVEDNDDMLASYVMVDPSGRFIDNHGNLYRTSPPILSVGVERALEVVTLNTETFENRGGAYDW